MQYCGFDNDDSLLTASLQCDFTQSSKEILSILHSFGLSLADYPAWKKLVSHMLLHGNDDAPKALEAAAIMAIKLKDKPWFDISKYIDMLQRSSPAYTTFTNIEKLFRYSCSESSCALIKDYLYQAPEVASTLLNVISRHDVCRVDPDRALICFKDHLKVHTDNIYLYISDDKHVKYKTICGESVSDVDLENLLSKKISPEVLERLRELISKESASRGVISRNKPIKPVLFADRIAEIDINLPSILRTLADNIDGTPRQKLLAAKEKEVRLACEQVIAQSKEQAQDKTASSEREKELPVEIVVDIAQNTNAKKSFGERFFANTYDDSGKRCESSNSQKTY